jgi:hypothetical protein
MLESMMRFLPLLAAGLLLAGCGSEPQPEPEPVDDVAAYEQALETQRELIGEITGVLEEVTDEASAEAAAPRIEELSGELQRLAVRINAMPQLPYAEQQRISRERSGSTAERRNAGKQMLKIEQYPVLKEAWARGMQGVEG